MPLVTILYNSEAFRDLSIDFVACLLPQIVARALTCDNPDGQLTSDDVEVVARSFIKGVDMFNAHYDLCITVDANLYPERLVNLDIRRKQIINQLRTAYANLPKGFVWVRLFPASFGEL